MLPAIVNPVRRYYLYMESKVMTIQPGVTLKNNYGSEFIVLRENTEKSTNNHKYYNIRFVESGYTDCVRGDSILSGLVKDNLSKSCCGVGSVGYINTRDFWHEHKIWQDMIYRCYSQADKSYKYYGGQGVSVCDRWHRFDLFVSDIESIPGFDREKFDAGMLRLDKDIRSQECKIYSPETTMWVTDLENQKQRAKEYNKKHPKYAIFPDGHIEQILHVTDFCKEHNLHRQNVNLCLAGKQRSSKGFRFYKGNTTSTDYPVGENGTL